VEVWNARCILEELVRDDDVERSCSTVFHILAIWTITSLATAFAYVAGRSVLSR
jgi:hypothetical protein